MDSKIKKIVLTGGPCAGKTEILEDIQKHLTDEGYYVIVLPEIATQLIGCDMPPSMEGDHALVFQDMVLKYQLLHEQQAERYAKDNLSDRNVVILCDRGIMDNRAYLNSNEEFEMILKANGLSEMEVLHDYDLVIDLISTATAKKDAYQLNGIRSESVEDAAALDKKTTMAWSMHPNLCVFKPMDTLEEKSDLVIKKIDEFLNNIRYNTRKKMLLSNRDEFQVTDVDDCRVLETVTSYLKDNLIVTHKKCGDSSIIFYGKYNSSDERIISEKELVDLLYRHPCVLTEKSREVSFVEDGNLYKIMNCDGKNYFYYDCTSSVTDMNDAVNCINKSFVKKKEQC